MTFNAALAAFLLENPMGETATIEVPAKSTALATAISSNQIEPVMAEQLFRAFNPLFNRADTVLRLADRVKVTDATQVTEIKQSRELRLRLRAIRTEAEKNRKQFKENALRVGRAIDGIYKLIETAVSPVEERLLAQEEFAERAEAARKAKLKAAREAELKPYLGDVLPFNHLGDVSAEEYEKLKAQVIAGHNARIAAEKKAEEERKAAEKVSWDDDDGVVLIK